MDKKYFLGLSEEGFHKVAYQERGKPDPLTNPIICVHGLTRQSHDFDPLADYLSYMGRHVFCPDIVGRGDSDWLQDPLHYTYEQYCADMTTLIARTQAEHVDWIGSSMGGLIGMFLAASTETPIRRLILNDVGPQIPAKAIARMSKYVGQEPDFSNLEEAKQYYKSTYENMGSLTETQWDEMTRHSVREIAPGIFSSKLDHGVKTSPAKSKIAWNLLLNPHKALEGTFFDIDLWHIWRKITCPVLVIRGELSDLLLPDTIKKMQKIHPRTDVIEIPNTGHAPMLFDREHHEIIYQWLAQH